MIRFSTMVLVDGQLIETEVREIDQARLLECPFFIMVSEHYNGDGSCKCREASEQRKMLRDWGYTRRDFKRAGIVVGFN